MRTIYFFTLFLLLGVKFLFAQYSVTNIPDSISKDAKAVVRLDKTEVDFLSVDKMQVKKTFVVTVFKKEGDGYAIMPMHYDKDSKVKEYTGAAFGPFGNLIKRFKKKDYKDVSAVDNSMLYGDNRVIYYPYTPTTYPYTIEHSFTYETSYTAFIPSWNPVMAFDLGVQESSYVLRNESSAKIQQKKVNPYLFDDIKEETFANGFSYTLTNFKPLNRESLCPSLDKLVPSLLLTANEYTLAGFVGGHNDWTSFGKWRYSFLEGRQNLPEKEKIKVKELLKGVEGDREKVRILYQYMQEKTRYIFVAIGIGGWQPYSAEYVSSKSYGDCKALSNFMIALLKEANIKANYTIVYGDTQEKRNIVPDFPSMQGNHIIVNVPMKNDTVWLECTSQQTAFNHLGDFTNDRYALSISENGGEIVKTQSYPPGVNKENINGTGFIDENGKLTFTYESNTSGLQYDWNMPVYYREEQDQKNWLERRLAHIKNIEIKEFDFKNDRNNAVFTQKVNLRSDKYAQIVGNNLVVSVVPVGVYESSHKKDSYRELPVEISEGFYDSFNFTINIPAGYKLNYVLEPVELKTKFGEYNLNLKVEGQKITVQRELKTVRGTFPKEDYVPYVEFRRSVEKADKTKLLFEKP